MLMQEIWLGGLDWDHVLPTSLATKWKRWVSELSDLAQFTIPRPLRLADPVSVELHVFSDASKDAHAAVSCRYNYLTSDRLQVSCRPRKVGDYTTT